MLKGVTLMVNYPDDEVEAAIPQEMNTIQLEQFLRRLIEQEPDATSFVLTAAIERSEGTQTNAHHD